MKRILCRLYILLLSIGFMAPATLVSKQDIPVPEMRKWTLADGSTIKLRLEGAYINKAYFAKPGAKHTNANITVFSKEEQAEILYWSRLQDLARKDDSDQLSDFTREFRKAAQQLDNGELIDANWDDVPESELYLIYTSASWCGPCREFTPRLVESYKTSKNHFGERFELMLCSWDKSKSKMIDYMEADEMPWYGNWKKRNSRYWRRFQGDGIPCLTLVDKNGVLIQSSYLDGKYLGPQVAMDKMNSLFRLFGPDPEEVVTVLTPGIPFDKLRKVIEKREKLAVENGEAMEVDIALKPDDLFSDLLDPEAKESEMNLSVTISRWGTVSQVRLTDRVNPELETRLFKALTLWQFLPAVNSEGITHGSEVVLPLRLPFKKELL